ncbi:MFS transporter [Candidatus Bathyarchaeota archaeon]|nr:MFS transporter [Candidatus Bathyarchaeota archaeon]
MLRVYRVAVDFIKGLDRRFKLMVAAMSVHQLAFNLPANYNQLYIVGLGANPVELGFLSSLGGFISSIISAPIGLMIDRYGVKRMVIYGLLISMLVAMIYYTASDWLMLIPAIMLAELGFRMIIPLADLIFMDIVESTSRAQAIALSRTVWAVPSIISPIIAAMIVASFGGIRVEGIRPLYLTQAVILASVAFLIYLKLEETHVAKGRSDVKSTGIFDGFGEIIRMGRRVTLWLIAMGLWRFSSGISMPYIPLWLVQVKGADPYIIGAIGTIGLASSALLQMPVGVLADKIGRKKVFLTIRPIVYLGTILLVSASSPYMLVAVGFLGAIGLMGGFSVISFTPFITMHWEMVPASMRGRWFGLSSLFESMAIVGYILGGYLWNYGYMELVLLLPLAIELLCIIPIVYITPEPSIYRSK